jgi:hypothetical protein
MTVQMHDLAAQRSSDGWRLSHVPHGGNENIHLLDEQGNALNSVSLTSSLPGFLRFAHWTTAGMSWSQQMLAYFTANQRHFVVRAWWGARLVIALDTLRPIDPNGLSDELRATECELVLRRLRTVVSDLENREYMLGDESSTNVLAHFPGLLGLAEAVPLLRMLEERVVESGRCHGSFRYETYRTRQLAQISLRRLGARPQGYPVLTFTESEKRLLLRQPQTGPIDGPTRHASLAQIKRSTPLAEVYRLLGAPDEIGRGKGSDFWRYDVDVNLPYTMLLWLAEDDAVARIVKYLPPFWTGPDVFPSREHSLLGSDGTTVVAYIDELDDGTFVGTRMEVDVLQDLASSGRYPLAPLARAILDGAYDGLGPLADALEEVDDPRAVQIRAWIKL